jgi:hypothetical protein
MSVFSWIGDLFSPVADLVDNVHTSTEEKGILRNKLAEIEAKVATRTLDLQSQIIEANSKVAISEQQHGNWLSKSWRPICSLGSFTALVLMGTNVMEYNQFLATIFGSFLGIYTGARSWEKNK